jgi:hypothetical protein
MFSSHGSRSTRTIGLCASLGLGLILASCTDAPDPMEADASRDVAADDASVFHDATVTTKDADQALHDAVVVTHDAGVIGDDVKAEELDLGAAVDTSPRFDTPAPIDGAMSPEARPACEMPRYSTNCIEVAMFECGFMAKCENGVISISWHQHACNGDSWVTSYNCTYTCPKGCKHDSVSWTSPGTKLVEDTCNP